MVCVSWFLFSAGCENKVESKVINNTMTKILNSVTQTSQQSISNLVTNWQDITINNKPGGVIRCTAGLNIKQILRGDMKVINEISSSQASEIKNQLKEEMSNEVKTIAQNNPSLFQSIFGKASNQTSISEVVNNLESEFNNTVKQESIQNIVNTFVNKQNQTINNEGLIEGSLCNFDQDLLINFQANNILKNVQSSLLTNDVFRKIQNNIETAAKTGGDGNKGKGKGKKGKGKKKAWIWIILIIVLLVIAISIYTKLRGNKVQIAVAATPAAVANTVTPGSRTSAGGSK